MIQIKRAYRRQGEVIRQNRMCFQDGEEEVCMEYLTFPLLEQTGMVNHLFSTRTGGVSEGMFESLNLSFDRGDDDEKVLHNYERVAKVLGSDVTHMVASKQTHTTNIRRVTNADLGKGVVKPRDYTDIDGLITDEKGIVLCTFYADCVPLYFVDTEHAAIGLAHSGWKGTAAKMGDCMVRAMQEQFGSRPEKLLAAIGPSICQDCYEVSGEVAEVFRKLENESGEILEEIRESGCYDDGSGKVRKILEPGCREGKFQLDLWLANLVILRNAGIPLKQIAVTDICTCHNPGYLFSHRASQGKRGNLGAFLMLKIEK